MVNTVLQRSLSALKYHNMDFISLTRVTESWIPLLPSLLSSVLLSFLPLPLASSTAVRGTWTQKLSFAAAAFDSPRTPCCYPCHVVLSQILLRQSPCCTPSLRGCFPIQITAVRFNTCIHFYAYVRVHVSVCARVCVCHFFSLFSLVSIRFVLVSLTFEHAFLKL